MGGETRQPGWPVDAGRDSAPGRAPITAGRTSPPSPPVTRRRRLGSCLRAPGKRHCEGPHARAPSLPTPPSAAAGGGRGGRPGSCAVTPNQRLGHRCQAARSSGGAHRAAGTWPAPRRSPLPAPWKATHSCGLGHRTLAARGGPEYLVPFRDTEAPETQVAGARHLLRTRSSRAHAWPVRTQGHRRRAEPEVPGPRATRRLGPGTEHVVRGHVSRSRVCWEEPAPCTEPTGSPRAAGGASPWQAVPATAVGPRLPSPRVTDRQGQSSS